MAIIQREMLSRGDSSSSEMMMIIPTSTTYSKWEGRKESVEVTMIAPKETVKFDETVRIRSYERILCEDPVSKYAGFVLGWDYKDDLKAGSLTGGEVDDETDDDDSATVHTSGTTSSADTAKEDCLTAHHNRFNSSSDINDRRATIRATRYTASERVKILSGYGFKMSEIIKLEFTKREQRDNMIAQERRRQKQQRKSSFSSTKDDARYANYIPSLSSSSLSQSTRRLSQTLRKKLHLKKINKRRVDINAWTE